jgi:hypothetical protein
MVPHVVRRAAVALTTKVSKSGKLEILTIPFKRPVKPFYIKKLVAFLRD